MKVFTFQEFRQLCRAQIATAVATITDLNKQAAAFPRADRSAVRQHANEFRELLVDYSNDPTPEKEEKLKVLREQGRTLRVTENIENGKKRCALNNAQRTPSVTARRWNWALALAKLRNLSDIEPKANEGAYDFVAVTWVELCKVIGIPATDRFRIKYKYGSIDFDGFTFGEWAHYPDQQLAEFTIYLQHAEAEAALDKTKAASKKFVEDEAEEAIQVSVSVG